MIHRAINVNDWEVDVFFCITKYEEPVLEEALRRADAPIGVFVRMRQIARDDEFNTGFTCANGNVRRGVMVIGKATDSSQLMNTFVHELYHLTTYIVHAELKNPYGEEAAYLCGDIAEKFTGIIGGFLCPKCGHVGKNRYVNKKEISQNPLFY